MSKKLSWDSSTLELSPTRRISKSLQKIYDQGHRSLRQLIWIFPLRVQEVPKITSIEHAEVGTLFWGKGKLINIKLTPAFGRRGKGRMQLFNIAAVVKDSMSPSYFTLRWFNSYPSLKKQIESLEEFTFLGEVTDFKGSLQIVNPKINESLDQQQSIVQYPTVNTVPGKFVKGIIEKIPLYLWDTPLSQSLNSVHKVLGLSDLTKAFETIHGKASLDSTSIQIARERLIYEEFLNDQFKILTRRKEKLQKKSLILEASENSIKEFLKKFPYTLTDGQVESIKEIQKDFSQGYPMMRILQGDVGCGKTTVSIIAAKIVLSNDYQVAVMCPTESLALQLVEEFSRYLGDSYSIAILLGSTKIKQKKIIYDKLRNGEIQLIVGTHSLFQDAVIFKKLAFAIIDEQHKFGVDQRQRLIDKGENTHTLIMSATPIPRTLQLAQYGDLDISTIRTIPQGRKGTQTRIVKDSTYTKLLSFIKTRISMGEQSYIVVPAIEESHLDISTIETLESEYRGIFPKLRIKVVHGKLSSEEKEHTLSKFRNHELDILISTSVIEVGINVLNATVMAIYNPERFGLSSLHQLRGRVGRGKKAGFCFLVTSKNCSAEAMQRLKILEKTTDGFEIAEADLKSRGQGDLFGVNQSGLQSSFRLANIVLHRDSFEKVIEDVKKLQNKHPDLIKSIIKEIANDKKVTSTI